MSNKIELGDDVKHLYTGFKGVAICRSSYLSGCDRITVQPKVKKDGSIVDALAFDEPECKTVKKRTVETDKTETGGFQPTFKHLIK